MTSSANSSTGPRTDEGKARSAQNSLKTGLFAAHDYILDNEREEYTETLHSLFTELSPKGVLEETFTAEIMSAQWRLRRCRLIESSLASRQPDDSEDGAREEKSIHRARAHSHAVLRRSLGELRKLQTERAIRSELPGSHLPGLADSRQITQAIKAYDRHQAWQAKHAPKPPQPDDLLAQLANADASLGMSGASRTYPGKFSQPGMPLVSSFCNPTLATPRNATCPCGSGLKFKRCCGQDAPPVLNMAA